MTRLVRVLAASAFVAVFAAPAGAQTAALLHARIRAWASRPGCATPASPRAAWSCWPTCRSRRASSTRSSRPASRTRRCPTRARRRPTRRTRHHQRQATSAAKAPAAKSKPAAKESKPPASGLGRAELRQLGPRVQRQPPLRRQLQRLQHLRHQHPGEADAADLGRVPGRAGRRVGARQPAVHVGRADARPPRLRRRRRRGSRQQGPLPWRAHLRHLGHEDAEAGRGRADVPWLAHAHPGHRSEGLRPTCTCTDRARRARARPRNSRAAPARTRRRIPRRRSSAST